MTELSHSLQSGMTLQHWTETNLETWLTLFTVDSPVRISLLQERVQDWQESEAAFLQRSFDSQKKHPLLSSSLKMCQQLEQEDHSKFKKHWPASGMILDGVLYPLPKLVQTIKEKDGSASLRKEMYPTPTAKTYGSNQTDSPNAKVRQSLDTMARKNTWPTPAARDWKDNGKSPAELKINSTTLATHAGGQLNPMWVEWLMGLPLGWTELKPWVTELFRFKSKQRLKS
jgi:hypothetical protein